jgi:D-tyrosyl-tRNA(Tyr) deacylase
MGAVRALVQRVSRASVRIEDRETRSIGRGLLVYLGVGVSDGPGEADKLAGKCANLRIFPNAEGKFDRSALDERAEALVISQFTLYGDPRGGRRPDFTAAARPESARGLYERFAQALSSAGLSVRTGEFGASMAVESVNDGPVTLWLDTERL